MGILDGAGLRRPQVPDAVTRKKMITGVLLIVGVILVLLLASKTLSNVKKGTYQIRQSWITGKVDAKMTPGWWIQLGDIVVWPKAETFYFTKTKKEGRAEDQSIAVQFNEGSLCDISGTCRVVLPKTAEEAISLTVERGFKTFGDLEHKLILPTVRNVLTLTANLMSARESYSDRRADFVFWARDQIASGLYETEGVTKKEKDPITGEVVTKVIKVIKMGPDGKPVRHVNPLAGTGITIDNFEIDRFFYDTKVNAQIEKQQQAFMDVQTAIVNAQKAEQDRLTAEAKGKADVMTSRYAEETKKAQEVVKAQKDKEVAEIKAAQELQVAKLMAQAAEQKKLAEILIAEGEAQAKRLKREADNYEALKIQAATEIHKYWAQAYANRRVPLVAGGFEEKSGEAQSGGMGVPKGLIDLLVLKALGINIDLGQRPSQAPQPQTK